MKDLHQEFDMSRWTRSVALRGVSVALCLAGAALTGISCRDDTSVSPTDPGAETEPALATTAAAALAFAQVSASSVHTCGVTTAGRAYCWGNNSYGQLGDGTTGDRRRPVAVAGTLRFRQLSAGNSHTCAVTIEYRAYCWGHNRGALGDGTTTSRLRPVPVAGGLKFLQVDAGIWFEGGASDHTCGVTYPDRRAYCWGDNISGQLGDGTTRTRLTPVPVAGGRQFRQVSAGLAFTCGATMSDEAFCWGRNKFAPLGDGTRITRLTPVRVGGGLKFRQVDTGFDHTCGVTTADRAYCWGWNALGQIGDGSGAYLRSLPKAVAGGLRFREVSAGADHTCGMTTSNRAYCWGWGSAGQLGDGAGAERVTPVAVAGGLTFAQLGAGDYHTCGKTPLNKAYCWGYNGHGQLGDGTGDSRLTPRAVVGPM